MFIFINALLSLLGGEIKHLPENDACKHLHWQIALLEKPIGISTTMPKKALADVSTAGERQPHMWYSHTWQWKKKFLESALAPFFVCLFTFFCLVNKTEKLEVLPSVEHVQRSEKWWWKGKNWSLNIASTHTNLKF